MSVAAMASGVFRSSKFVVDVKRAKYCSSRWLVARPSQEGVQRPKSENLVSQASAPFFQRRAGTIGGADQSADARARNDVDRNASFAKNAKNPDVRDAPRKAAGQRNTNADGWRSPLECRHRLNERKASLAARRQTLRLPVFSIWHNHYFRCPAGYQTPV